MFDIKLDSQNIERTREKLNELIMKSNSNRKKQSLIDDSADVNQVDERVSKG